MKSTLVVNLLVMAFITIGDSAVLLKSAKATVMENEAMLDPRGNMLVRWTIVANGTGIEMEFQANCTGWMGNMILKKIRAVILCLR